MKLLFSLMITFCLLTACTEKVTEKINFETSSEKAQKQIVNGSFSTKITDKKEERLHNIQLGIEKLNGAIINPGEEFSFNKRVGPRTDEAGFEKAIIFDGNGNKTDGYGGGLCQISSTLYNAVLSAGLEVTERHEHSRDVTYIEKGKDACVAYNSEDFKFKNISSRTVKISATTDNDFLNITVSSET